MCRHLTRRDLLTLAGASLLAHVSPSAAQTPRAAPTAATTRAIPAPETVRAMAAAANAFIASLRPELRKSLMFSMDDPERQEWSNLPHSAYPRKGLRMGLLNDDERRAAHALLQTILSGQGYLKATAVMLHDDVFNENSIAAAAARGVGGGPVGRGTFAPGGRFVQPARTFTQEELAAARGLGAGGGSFGAQVYFLDVFGTPGGTEPWGVQLDGHHLGVNVTVVDNSVTISPTFLGSEPALIMSGVHAGWQIFGAETRLGFELRNSLTPEQAKTAVLSEDFPPDLFTGPVRRVQLQTMQGLSALRGRQRGLLESLIDEYVGNAPFEVAEGYRRAILAAGFDKIHFAWMGAKDPSQTAYYRIHGPGILIEYENLPSDQQASGPRPNHIHSILHVPGNDYGEDWLRRHHLEHDHVQP